MRYHLLYSTKELSRDELLNEELAYDAWVDAKYDALKEEAVLCGYCKVPMDGEELICGECFDEIFGTTSDNGEGSASPPEKGNQAVGGTDGTDEEQACATIVDMYNTVNRGLAMSLFLVASLYR